MQLWHRDLEFIDPKSGRPRTLPRIGKVSFRSLVRRVGPELRPADVLAELLRAKAARVNTRGHVVALSFAHIENDPQRRSLIGLHAVNHILKTIVGNLRSPSPQGLYQRETVCFDFDRRQVKRANLHHRTQAQDHLKHMDEWSHQYAVTPGAPRQRRTVLIAGSYMTLIQPNEPTSEMRKARSRSAAR
jgi:hypothetical protein